MFKAAVKLLARSRSLLPLEAASQHFARDDCRQMALVLEDGSTHMGAAALNGQHL